MANYHEFEYRLSKKTAFTILIIFGTMSFITIPKALNNDKALQIKRMVTLSPEMADWFWIGCALICVAFAITGVLAVIKSFQEPDYVIIEDETITLPKRPISNTIATIRYDEITKLTLQDLGKAQTLTIKTNDGKCVLSSAGFENNDDFQRIVYWIYSKTDL